VLLLEPGWRIIHLRNGKTRDCMKSESKARRSNVDPIAGRVMGGMNQRMRTVSRPGTAAAQCTLSGAKGDTAV
jgi:hypothetical protein